MIGVATDVSNHEIVCEFFELFKIEWEFERPGILYDAVIRSSFDSVEQSNARLIIIYGTAPGRNRTWSNFTTRSGKNRVLLLKKDRLPIYGACLSFPGSVGDDVLDESTSEPVMLRIEENEAQTLLWIGYDLWAEIRHLLVNGQPESFAGTPALELHIELLGGLLRRYEIVFSEVPPIPEGYNFIACLTHDVDHASIRSHKLDGTIIGFLYRATIQSLFHFLTGRKSITDLLRNWAAVISLPLVQLGLLPDTWSRFDNYTDVEGGLPSTFFVVPKPGDPGRLRDGGKAPKRRAVRYALAKISDQLQHLRERHHEIALHGINAWLTTDDATGERAELQGVLTESGRAAISGVRMHWLYYDESSAGALDDAGFEYDSSIGYNQTIGYRSGTCQVYKVPGTKRLKELPLHVMDTALLFPGYMNLSPADAKTKVSELISNVKRFGGVLTINWHDRSIAPERLWHRLYRDILTELRNNGAWFATASQVVGWFEKRRAFVFDSAAVALSKSSDGLPRLTIKQHVSLHSVAMTTEPVELAVADI